MIIAIYISSLILKIGNSLNVSVLFKAQDIILKFYTYTFKESQGIQSL